MALERRMFKRGESLHAPALLHNVFIPRTWQLRGNITAYDSAYVALAEALRAPLVTCDAKLADAPGVRATVELFA